MNIFENVTKFLVGLIFLILCSCEKEGIDSANSSISNEIDKVETIYKEGDVKIEFTGRQDFIKVETLASETYKAKIRQELEKSLSKQTTYLKSGSGSVGILKNGSCGIYQELLILMDCEDGNFHTNASGYIGSSSIDEINGNVTLACCVLPAGYLNRGSFDFAVLDFTGAPLPSGVNGFTRYIDNEDSNNKNNVTLDGTKIGSLGACLFNGNTNLVFQFYPKLGEGAIGIYEGLYLHDFGVFAKEQLWYPESHIVSSGRIFSDDEDSGNANRLTQIKNLPFDCTTNVMDGGVNTTFYFTWIHLESRW